MKIMNRVTLQHLLKNKKRTLVTLIGTIVSVAMIMAVATLGFSFMDFMRRAVETEEGSWHAVYRDLTNEQVAAIQADSETAEMSLQQRLGFALLEGGKNESRPYLLVQATDRTGPSMLPYHLTKGRMPQNGNEVVITEYIKTNGGAEYKIGDVLRLELGERYWNDDLVDGVPRTDAQPIYYASSIYETEMGSGETFVPNGTVREFTIVGIMERPSTENYSVPGYTVLTCEDRAAMDAQGDVDAYISVKTLSNDIYNTTAEFAESNGIGVVEYNSSLLRYSGVIRNDTMRSTLYRFMGIIIFIIMAGSVALIYNAFAISVSERARHLGMLSSVGATKRQKRNSVFFEGFVIGIISIPLGVLFGYLGIRVTTIFIAPLMENLYFTVKPVEFRAVISQTTIIISVVLSAVTIFVSVWIPAKRASRVMPIDAIRQSQDVKLRRKDVKTSRLTRKIFGFEAEIGLKNLKRNRKRYRVTVFSLMISVVLFLSVASFTTYLNKSVEVTDSGINYDVAVGVSDGLEDWETLYTELRQLEGITKATVGKRMYLYTYLPKEALTDTAADGLQEYWGNVSRAGASNPDEDEVYCEIRLTAIDDAALAEYAREVGADLSKLEDTGSFYAIAVNQAGFYEKDDQKYTLTELFREAEGRSVALATTGLEDGEPFELDMGAVTILASTEKTPQGVYVNYSSNSLNLIVSDEVFRLIAAGDGDNMEAPSLYLDTPDSEALALRINTYYNENYAEEDGTIYVYDAHEAGNETRKLMTLLGVLIGGFISLITVICIANIFNTISTSIGLRKREFAMLKSVGMTPEGFNKMLRFESLFYGIKALLWGLPVSFLIMVWMYRTLSNNFGFGFLIPWESVLIAVAAVFSVVGLTMMYSSAKIKKENIIDALKDENL